MTMKEARDLLDGIIEQLPFKRADYLRVSGALEMLYDGACEKQEDEQENKNG